MLPSPLRIALGILLGIAFLALVVIVTGAYILWFLLSPAGAWPFYVHLGLGLCISAVMALGFHALAMRFLPPLGKPGRPR
jgi:hypothetical protein